MEIDYLKKLHDKYSNRVYSSTQKVNISLNRGNCLISYNSYFKPNLYYKHGLIGINKVFRKIYEDCEFIESDEFYNKLIKITKFIDNKNIIFSANKTNLHIIKNIQVDKLVHNTNFLDIDHLMSKVNIISKLSWELSIIRITGQTSNLDLNFNPLTDIEPNYFNLKFAIYKFSIEGIEFLIYIHKVPLLKVKIPGIKSWEYKGIENNNKSSEWISYLYNCGSIGNIFNVLDNRISNLEHKIEYAKIKNL